jgi:tetratricopeptide (TPR) repeat protein
MAVMRACRRAKIAVLLIACSAVPAGAAKLTLPPDAPAILEQVYSFDLAGAVEAAKRMEAESTDHPLGYLLEAEALWWRIWCTSADFKYGLTDARHRPKLEADKHYFRLAGEALSLAEARIKRHETAEMHFYAGMADAAAARLYALRAENRSAARAGVRCREHLLRAKTLDPDLADADFGLGLYNYYVDTLSALARVLRFLMGIPGGSKQEGVHLLEQAIAEGVLTPSLARFYLALNLHRYDEQYQKALAVIGPLAEKYPTNPLFQLALGDIYAKLGRREKALDRYRAVGSLKVQDAECQMRVRELVRASIGALVGPDTGSPHGALARNLTSATRPRAARLSQPASDSCTSVSRKGIRLNRPHSRPGCALTFSLPGW